VDIITTTPNVRYKVETKSDDFFYIDSPSKMPAPHEIKAIMEPVAHVQIVIPTDYVGAVMKLCENKRGRMQHMDYLETTRVCLHYRIPLSEMVIDFFDKLKSCSRGYGSMDYELAGYEENNLIRLDVKINGTPVDAFSSIVHQDQSYAFGQYITSKLKELIPRQMTEVAIQASTGSRVIARTTVKPLRKNVTAKCYGGDVSRKRKLLEKQKEGKKRMKKVSSVDIPQEAFLALLKRE
jgi:GTP-binding protein LepA